MNLAGDYLGEEILFFSSMGTWLHHIDRYKQQYYKFFAKDPLFGADLMDCIHKSVYLFLTLLQHNHHIGRGVGGPCGV